MYKRNVLVNILLKWKILNESASGTRVYIDIITIKIMKIIEKQIN